MKKIGFGGTFYTLWNVETERVDLYIGAYYYKTNCIYIKNLSKNLSEAIDKAGTSNVDDTLKGRKKTFSFDSNVIVNPLVITEKRRLYEIICANRVEYTKDVKKEAFERAISLGFLKVVYGNFTKYIDGDEFSSDKLYSWDEDNVDDVWYSESLEVMFSGIA